MNLNPAQLEAVRHIDGPLLIFAGAGSGKTRVLTYRVAHLLQEGIDPYHVIAITFTNKAAREMRERITAITPMGEQVWVSTFHAACVRILRRDIEFIGFGRNFSIYDAQDSQRLVKECMDELKLNEIDFKAKSVAGIISAQKNELISPAEYEKKHAGSFREGIIGDIYRLYQERLQAANALDFDDIIFKTVELLQQHEEVRLKYQNRFRYVMVDEYQDTNNAQYELVRLLSGYAHNLCVVGDDDQSIYGWRGANIQNILRFEKDYPGAKVVKLEENYRSTQMILDAANGVISHNLSRADKRLWTAAGQGDRVRFFSAMDDKEEANFVAKVIGQMAKTAPYSDFAVLYRANYQSRLVEGSLSRGAIPYRLYGGVRFYERQEIKDILAYMRVINNPADEMAFLRVINVPRRGIGAATISKVQAYAFENRLSFYQAIKRAPEFLGKGKIMTAVLEFSEAIEHLMGFSGANSVPVLIDEILATTGYIEAMDKELDETEGRIENIVELQANAADFARNADDASLAKFLEDVALVADIDNYEENANAVTLMTMHTAKGLEFNTVFIVGCEENIFPSKMSLDAGGDEQVEEERRLCYVGITRAKKALFVTRAKERVRFRDVMYNQPSRFLEEMPDECITLVNYSGNPVEKIASLAGGGGFGVGSPATIERKPWQQAAAKKKPSLLDFATRITPARPTPKNLTIDYGVGDRVQMAKYGVGEVLAIDPAGADFEVTIEFDKVGRKKFMAHLLRITKVE
ncbi:MAG: UvrD-helicase domain-containing protein [Defluviitaleaceae bacterium]|nr:UvrD-helicase domain-containing protein [Defluviitaleaceae bacterium]